MRHYKALTETKKLYGATLCGLDEDSEITTNIKVVDCPECQRIYEDITDGLYIDLTKRDSSNEDSMFLDLGITVGGNADGLL